MRLSDASMKTVSGLRARIVARGKEVEGLIATASKMHGIKLPPETHLIRPRWKGMTELLERLAAGYARDRLNK